MTVDESNQIEELFDEWYDWQAGYMPSLGYGRIDSSCRGFSESESTLTANERSEEAGRKAAKKRAQQVDVCVDALTWQERAAIQRHMKTKRIGAMNEACGAKAWTDPRTYGEVGSHELYQQAKRAICSSLRRRGLLSTVHEVRLSTTCPRSQPDVLGPCYLDE